LTTGLSGTPGLLAQGGALGSGLPLTRPDLYLVYNLIDTVPLITAFLYQARRSTNTSCDWVYRGAADKPG